MFDSEIYRPILSKTADLVTLENNNGDSVKIKKLRKEIYQDSATLAIKLRNEFSTQHLEEQFTLDMEKLKEIAAENVKPIFNRFSEILLSATRKELNKSPLRSNFETNYPLLIIMVLIFSIFTVKWFFVVKVTEPANVSAGLLERSKAFGKILHYENLIDGEHYRPILFWTLKPTKKEYLHAEEFIAVSSQVYSALKSQNLVCSRNFRELPNDETSKEEVAIASIAHDYLEFHPHPQETDAVKLLTIAFRTYFSCK